MPSYTFYPDPSVESTSVDGEITSGTHATWAGARDATSGTAADSATTITLDIGRGGAGNYSINRGFMLFDTSAITDTDTVTAGTVSLYATSKVNNVNDGQDFISIITTNPASNTALANGDYDAVEGTDNNNPLGTGIAMKEMHDAGARIDLSAITTSAYNSWALNSTGLGYINVSGITKFGAAGGNDVTNTAYAGGSTTNNTLVVISADTALTSTDPKLEVTTTAASPSGVVGAIGGGIISTA